jgi:hypothetical protein
LLITFLGVAAIVFGAVAKVMGVHETAELLLKVGFAFILFDMVVEVANHYKENEIARTEGDEI